MDYVQIELDKLVNGRYHTDVDVMTTRVRGATISLSFCAASILKRCKVEHMLKVYRQLRCIPLQTTTSVTYGMDVANREIATVVGKAVEILCGGETEVTDPVPLDIDMGRCVGLTRIVGTDLDNSSLMFQVHWSESFANLIWALYDMPDGEAERCASIGYHVLAECDGLK